VLVFETSILCALLTFVSQIDSRVSGERRTSLGHRKLETRDRILLWPLKKRQGFTFIVLGVLFGVSDQSAHNYCAEIHDVFSASFLPRLFYLPHVTEIDPYIPKPFKEAFPNIKIVGDGVHFPAQTPEQFSSNNLTFCIYKWGTTWQIIIREWIFPLVIVSCAFVC
jgi:hypothetical protein